MKNTRSASRRKAMTSQKIQEVTTAIESEIENDKVEENAMRAIHLNEVDKPKQNSRR